MKPLENIATEGGDGAPPQTNTNTTIDNNNGSKNDNNNNNNPGASGFLRVAAPSFDLKTTASAARRTSPCLFLATGERGDAESNNPPWLRHQAGGNGHGNSNSNSNANGDDDNGAEFMTRSSPRPGSRNPAWKDGEFWLSLEGLQDPALFLALEDSKKASQAGGRGGDGGGGGGVSEEAILAEACIPLPLEEMRRRGDGGRWGSRSGGSFEAELRDGVGVVSLQWSVHKDTSSMRTGV